MHYSKLTLFFDRHWEDLVKLNFQDWRKWIVWKNHDHLFVGHFPIQISILQLNWLFIGFYHLFLCVIENESARSRLKWTVLGQSNRLEGIKVDGPKKRKWAVMYETGSPKGLKVDLSKSSVDGPVDSNWTVLKHQNRRSKGMKVDGLNRPWKWFWLGFYVKLDEILFFDMAKIKLHLGGFLKLKVKTFVKMWS